MSSAMIQQLILLGCKDEPLGRYGALAELFELSFRLPLHTFPSAVAPMPPIFKALFNCRLHPEGALQLLREARQLLSLERKPS